MLLDQIWEIDIIKIVPTWGGSAIIDPWGNIMNELEDGPGIITANIDLGYLKSLRSKIPVHNHRRFSILKP